MLQEKHPGKKILITGVTRGLGKALAERYIADGHVVIGCGRGAEGILDLRFAHSAPHDFAVVDVAEPSKVELWAEKVLAVHGAPDVIINNAAVMVEPSVLWKVPADKFSKLIDVNIKGVVNVIRAFVPAMLEAKRGVIVNLSSGWGRSVAPEVAPYCASKWAIEGLTKSMAMDLPDPLAAIPLSPGIIHTDMLAQCIGENASSYPTPQAWVEKAAPFILSLGRKDNGKSVSVPQ